MFDPAPKYNHYELELDTARYSLDRAATEKVVRCVDNSNLTQGKVFWLPAKENLPERAVKRAHGKGAVEEGIYNHPVVAVSQPSDDSRTVHFHLITSFQGKRLDQLYAKPNEFHASRRSWYLPVAPTPDHPDALSKKTKKRFPTLKLENGARLRWDSYVNIRHVYKIDLSRLEPYTNPEYPGTEVYRFEGESVIRMLAKGKTLTMYEPGPQFVSVGLVRSHSAPTPTYSRKESQHTTRQGTRGSRSPASDPPSAFSAVPSVASGVQGDFQVAVTDDTRIAGPIPKVPPDGEKGTMAMSLVQNVIVLPTEQLFSCVKSVAIVVNKKFVAESLGSSIIRQPLDRFWRDLKGVTAVVIASL
ncbi:hypothetical protein CC86DRAFT_390037 [Ophiobolus disseminans]|uniref:Uncharacterized protein n=1 Tax=Ophiobolus disseminans TaxID=1469910 RepID=A0A6A7AN60_9PLEO|nr:hypothetical protein CC86DRAFT_390037 [Ophiobolus disseminans]